MNLPPNKSLLLMAAILMACSLLGCGGSGASTATNGAVSPNYTGTEVANGVSAPFAISFTENGSQLNGFWGHQFSGVATTGTLTGSVSGGTVTVTLTPNLSFECSVSLTGTLNQNTFSGTVSTVNCPNPESGTFAVQTSATPPNLASSATGTLEDNVAGTGNLAATITQNGMTIGGTFNDSFLSAQVAPASGNVYGFVVGSNVYFTLWSASGACPTSATGTLNGSALTGNYTAAFCSTADSGAFSITL